LICDLMLAKVFLQKILVEDPVLAGPFFRAAYIMPRSGILHEAV